MAVNYSYIENTDEIAEQLVEQILNILEPGELSEARRAISEELAKYFEAGGILWSWQRADDRS